MEFKGVPVHEDDWAGVEFAERAEPCSSAPASFFAAAWNDRA